MVEKANYIGGTSDEPYSWWPNPHHNHSGEWGKVDTNYFKSLVMGIHVGMSYEFINADDRFYKGMEYLDNGNGYQSDTYDNFDVLY